MAELVVVCVSVGLLEGDSQKRFGFQTGGLVAEEREAEGMAGTEVIIEANPDSFKENVKLEDDAKDGGGGARKKRRSSLFSAVAKATSILRYCRGLL